MADARDVKVWTVHAEEQWENNREPHQINDDAPLRIMLTEAVPKGSRALDLGCGGGLWRNLFRDYEYLGVDQNAGMIKRAKERGETEACRFQQIQWDKLPFEDNTFDVVFTSAVLQHNKHADKEKVVREMCRVLKPGGIYLATENTFRPDNYQHTFRNKEFSESLDDGYSFTRAGWEEFMKPLGFELVKFSNPSEYVWKVNK